MTIPYSSPHWVNEDQERGVLISPDWKSKDMYVAERLLLLKIIIHCRNQAKIFLHCQMYINVIVVIINGSV